MDKKEWNSWTEGRNKWENEGWWQNPIKSENTRNIRNELDRRIHGCGVDENPAELASLKIRAYETRYTGEYRFPCNWHGMRKKPVYIIGNKCPAVRRNILRALRASLHHDREYRLLMLTMVREKLDPDKVFHHWWTNICRLTRNMVEKIFSHQGIFDIFDVEFNIFNVMGWTCGWRDFLFRDVQNEFSF